MDMSGGGWRGGVRASPKVMFQVTAAISTGTRPGTSLWGEALGPLKSCRTTVVGQCGVTVGGAEYSESKGAQGCVAFALRTKVYICGGAASTPHAVHAHSPAPTLFLLPLCSMEGGRQADVAKGILSSKNVPYVVAAPLLIQVSERRGGCPFPLIGGERGGLLMSLQG